MKRIFAIFTIALGLMLPMQAQLAPINKELKMETSMARKQVRKAPAATAAITAETLAGKYVCTAASGVEQGATEVWEMTITVDENDANKLWLQPIILFADFTADDIEPVYATFNAADATISLPLGQVIYKDEAYGVKAGIGTSLDGVDVDTTSDMILTFVATEDGAVEITGPAKTFFGVGNLNGNEWWYQAVYDLSFVKTIEYPSVYIYRKGAPYAERIEASQLFFNEVDGEMCVTTTPTISEGIEGVYAVTAESAFQGKGTEEWEMTLSIDEADPNKIWFHPICMFGNLPVELIEPIYGTYDKATSIITVPMGQLLYEANGYEIVLASADDTGTATITGAIEVEFDGRMAVTEYVVGVVDAQNIEGGWYQALLGFEMSKDGQVIPLAEIEKITREKPIPSAAFLYFLPGDYTWTMGLPVSQTEVETVTSTTTFTAGEQFDLSELFEGAEGVVGTNWLVSGFMEDIVFEEGDTPCDLKGVSYQYTTQEGVVDIMTFLDPETGYSSIGTVVLQDQAGNPVPVDLFLADLVDSQRLTNPNFVAYSETEISFDGEALVLFYVYGGGAYLYGQLVDVTIAPATATRAASMAIDAKMVDKATVVGQGQVLKFAEKSFGLK